MNLILKYRGLNARAVWQQLVEAQVQRLKNLVAIASVRVILERRHETSPAFHVMAHLEVPGPDFHAEASGYTLQAAWLKVARNLERQIRSRKGKQTDRWKTNARPGLLSARMAVAGAAGHA